MTSSEPKTTQPQRNAHQRMRFDLALMIALVPIVAATIRIWMYSGGDSALFLVLLRTINIPAVLVGTAVLMIPSLLTLAIVVLLTDRKARIWMMTWFAHNHWALTVATPIVLIVVAYTTSWLYFVGLAAVGVVALSVFLIRREWRKRRAKSGKESKPRGSGFGPDSFVTILTVVAFFFVAPSNMWLPLERVSVSGQSSEVGYVLESTSEWTTILTKERELDVIVTSDIRAREVCEVYNPGTLALLIQHGGLKGGVNCD